MNLTLAVDDEAVERARAVAAEQGTSLNALIRSYIERLAGKSDGAALANRMKQLWSESSGTSRGKKIRREDAYEGRLK